MNECIITSVQRYSLHDGPGIRTTVFFKGCQLTCPWCHNPETIKPRPELLFYPEKCIGCGRCMEVCKTEAHKLDASGRHVLDRTLCKQCFTCSDECFADTLQQVGNPKNVQDLMSEIMEDEAFYRKSNGGVTLSGGEPLLQVDFAAALLNACKEKKLHTALESNLAFPWTTVQKVLGLVDLFMVDVKVFDSQVHKKLTGMDNANVLKNLREISGRQTDIIVRTPIVSGLTDDAENITNIAKFCSSLKSLRHYELLTYHPMGCDKLMALGRSGDIENFVAPTRQTLDSLITEIKKYDITAYIDGKKA